MMVEDPTLAASFSRRRIVLSSSWLMQAAT